MSDGRNSEVDFRGQPRSNKTHRSTTDPEALLARKSDAAPAKLSYAGHVLMEHRSVRNVLDNMARFAEDVRPKLGTRGAKARAR